MKQLPLMFLLVLVLSLQAFALTYVVTRSDDRNAICQSNDCSFREAVNAANLTSASDNIWFSALVTKVTLSGSQIIINNNGALSIIGANVITGQESTSPVISGANLSRILYVKGATISISLLTFKNGNGADGVDTPKGDAISVNGGSLNLDGVHIEG